MVVGIESWLGKSISKQAVEVVQSKLRGTAATGGRHYQGERNRRPEAQEQFQVLVIGAQKLLRKGMGKRNINGEAANCLGSNLAPRLLAKSKPGPHRRVYRSSDGDLPPLRRGRRATVRVDASSGDFGTSAESGGGGRVLRPHAPIAVQPPARRPQQPGQSPSARLPRCSCATAWPDSLRLGRASSAALAPILPAGNRGRPPRAPPSESRPWCG